MAILAGDIKLVASAVMDDVPEGGGAPTAHVVADGASNGIFNDISEVDRAGGRDNLRKLFVSVQTPDTDGYFGANVIVAEPPSDPRVSVTLFTTKDTFDTRNMAKSRIESYLALGAPYPGYLFGDHMAGQMTVTLLQSEGLPLPVNSDTLVLRKNNGQPSQVEQYVKVVNVTSRLRAFSDDKGPFSLVEVTMGISDALSADFPGYPPRRSDPSVNGDGTRCYGTVVADAARYYGVVPLTQAAAIGDYSIKASGIFAQLVPSTKIEVPIADARLNQRKAALLKAGDNYTDSVTLAFTTSQAMYLGAKILPGSLTLSRSGLTLTDKGGALMNAGTQVGSIDYDNGILTLTTNVFGSTGGTHSVSYTPAASPGAVTSSIGIPVTQQNQRLTWVVSIDTIPARGSLQISYRAMSRWIVLTDDGSGAVRGSDSSFGIAGLNYTTGSVSITLGALPDVGSQIILQWVDSAGSRALNLIPNAGPTLPMAVGKTLQINRAVKPGTIILTWNDGSARTATDAGGTLTGDATGAINYANGRIHFRPNLLPPKNTSVTLAITNATPMIKSILAYNDGGANWTCTFEGAVKPRSLEMLICASYTAANYWNIDPIYANVERLFHAFDDGSGNLQITSGTANVTIGSINYATGECALSKTVSWSVEETVRTQVSAYNADGKLISYDTYKPEAHTKTLAIQNHSSDQWYADPSIWWPKDAQTFAVRARYAGSDGGSETFTFTLDNLFHSTAAAPTAFHVGGVRHVCQGDGTIVRAINPATGAGTPCGTIGPADGEYGAVLTDWAAGTSSAVSNLCGCSAPGVALLINVAVFRTAIAPLFNGGFSIIGNRYDGSSFNVTPDSTGVINNPTAGVFGLVDFNTGIVTVRFGTPVADSAAADPGVTDIRYLGIPGVNYILTTGVQADTLRYNAVGYSYLPLDANLLGLNPVRLPGDGRVPIFRAGSFVVVGHTGKIGPVTVSNGQTIDCARVRLSRVRVIDANKAVINTGYSTDLDAGRVTFNDVSGYAQPIVIEHRIEDMMLVSDAQINGQLTFTRPVTHDYPQGAYVSSALIIGDMHARVSTLFDQQTWGNVWSDGVSGNDATGTYNAVLAPIEVTNKGALTERWAIQFTNTTSFNVIGEHVGVIATGTPAADCAPLNPATGMPYFTIRAIGWGSGWSAGNVLRFNTVGACYPIWVVRTIQQGPATAADDQFTLLIRGDVDKNP